MVQRTISYVKDAALSHVPSLQSAALDVLAFTVNQGLYHPLMVSAKLEPANLQLLPVLVPLEASEDKQLADNALALHSTLHLKHSGSLNVQYLEFVRHSFEYLRTVSSEVSGIRRGGAALAGWYGLLSEKRAWKLEFIRALTKAFDFDLEGNDPVSFAVVV